MSRFSVSETVKYVVLLLLLATAIVAMFITGTNEDFQQDTGMVQFSGNWISQDGSEVSIDKINYTKSICTFSKKINSSYSNGKSICFRSKNMFFSVSFDGKTIYNFKPEIPRIFGKSYGAYVHCVKLPDFDGQKNIEIKLEPIYNDSACYI